jgi:hypothetical protein
MGRDDTETLARLGKRQVLKRRFYFWSLFAFAVCELITWETVLALFAEGLRNGGPAGLIYGFIIAWVSTMYVRAFPNGILFCSNSIALDRFELRSNFKI